MVSDKPVIDTLRKQIINIVVLDPSVGLEEYQRIDFTDTGHQFDTQQVGETEYYGTLSVGVALYRVRLNIGFIFDNGVN